MPQNSPEITVSLGNTKPPRLILPGIFAFTPNRDTLGATSYLIVDKSGNVLVDCPAWHQVNQEFIHSQGGVKSLVITHRGGIGKNIMQIQADLNCQVIVQEQEAYLLPEVETVDFASSFAITDNLEIIWTCGHSPGSSCLYYAEHGGILFSGRHLLPKSPSEIIPLRTAKTFHWWRQLDSVAKLCDRFDPDTLKYILPGANTGYLRGTGYIENAYKLISSLDLAALRSIKMV